MRLQGAHNQRGVALMAALILVMALAFILANIFYRHQIDVSQAAASLHGDRAILLAISAENWARQLLVDDDDNVDHFGEDWAQAIPALPVEGGTVNGCIADLQGRFNLNSFGFGAYTTSKLSQELGSSAVVGHATVWNGLLNHLQIPVVAGRVATIIDWIDGDSSLVSSSGAEQDDYAGMMPPRMVGNQQMVEPSELAAVRGYEVFEVQALMPWLSALPATTTININTASDELLLALGADDDVLFRDTVVENRPFDDLDDFYTELAASLQLTEEEKKEKVEERWPDTVIDVKTQYFELYIEVIVGEARIEVKSTIKRGRSGNNTAIIARNLTVVPNSLPKQHKSLPSKRTDAGLAFREEDDDNNPVDSAEVQPACAMIEAV